MLKKNSKSLIYLVPMSLETLPALAASMMVPQRRFFDSFWDSLLLLAPVPSPGTLLVLVWCRFGAILDPKIPLRVLPKSSCGWSSCECCRDAVNSATGGSWPLPDGCGAMLKPFISLLSFWRFFLPPAPMDNSFTLPSTTQTKNHGETEETTRTNWKLDYSEIIIKIKILIKRVSWIKINYIKCA